MQHPPTKPALVPHPLPVISCPVPIRRQIGLNQPPNQPTTQTICRSNPQSIPQIWYQATLISAGFDPTSEYIGFHDFESAPYRRSLFWGFTIGAAHNPKMFAFHREWQAGDGSNWRLKSIPAARAVPSLMNWSMNWLKSWICNSWFAPNNILGSIPSAV